MLLVGFSGGHHRICREARIAGCYDGDTCKAFVAGPVERVRLVGFDTPELAPRSECRKEHDLGIVARDRLNSMIRSARDKQFCSDKPDEFSRDDYGRILAVLLLDGRDVAATLIDEGLAVPYAGGRKLHDWCV